MASVLQRIYWRAPLPVKNWLASMKTRLLERQRYSVDYQRSREELCVHDAWGKSEFLTYVNSTLSDLLVHAAEHVPYYRQMFANLGFGPNRIASVDDLPLLPLLDKDTLRENPTALLDERLIRQKLIVVNTSGTTGTPLTIYHDAHEESYVQAASDIRWHEVAEMRRGQNRSVTLGGHLVTAPGRRRPPFWVINKRWKQLYMSSYHLSTANLGAYVEAIRDFDAEYIEGYPSSLYAIAAYIIETGLKPVQLKACYTTSETLNAHQRNTMQQAFQCPVYDQYGSAELVVFAADCQYGNKHISPEIGVVEVLDGNGKPLPAGQEGELVCTSLLDRVQPLIRYRIGDRGSLSAETCPCGSVLPMLGGVTGRTDEVLITRDGKRIGRLDTVFKGVHNVRESQIIQEDYEVFHVRVVPGTGYSNADAQKIMENLHHRLGTGVDIKVEVVTSIPRTSRGKFRAVVCNLPEATWPWNEQ